MTNHPNRSSKTVRLAADRYRVNNGAVEAFYATATDHQFDYDNPSFTDEMAKCESWDWHSTRYEIGAQAVLVNRTDVSPNAIRAGKNKPSFYLSFDLDGVAGNMNRKIKSVTGWRGTTDDVSVDAHGIVTIRKIRTLRNGDIAVTVR